VIDEDVASAAFPCRVHEARVAHRVRDLVYAAPDPEAAEGESRYGMRRASDRMPGTDPSTSESIRIQAISYTNEDSPVTKRGEEQADEIGPERLGSVPRLCNELRRFRRCGR